MSKIISTNCCKNKNASLQPLKARHLYTSERIDKVYSYSQTNMMPFYILSGQFGLIHCEDKIPYYDHLLKLDEVVIHAQRVGQQMLKLNIESIQFIHRSLDADPNLKVYILCLEKACQIANARLILTNYEEL